MKVQPSVQTGMLALIRDRACRRLPFVAGVFNLRQPSMGQSAGQSHIEGTAIGFRTSITHGRSTRTLSASHSSPETM